MLETTIKKFNGLSVDEKPSAPPEGSTWHSIDTGETWIFHNGMWVVDLRLSKALKM